jgi:hypothetical protein
MGGTRSRALSREFLIREGIAHVTAFPAPTRVRGGDALTRAKDAKGARGGRGIRALAGGRGDRGRSDR